MSVEKIDVGKIEWFSQWRDALSEHEEQGIKLLKKGYEIFFQRLNGVQSLRGKNPMPNNAPRDEEIDFVTVNKDLTVGLPGHEAEIENLDMIQRALGEESWTSEGLQIGITNYVDTETPLGIKRQYAEIILKIEGEPAGKRIHFEVKQGARKEDDLSDWWGGFHLASLYPYGDATFKDIEGISNLPELRRISIANTLADLYSKGKARQEFVEIPLG
jgi:hypothetical protein